MKLGMPANPWTGASAKRCSARFARVRRSQ